MPKDEQLWLQEIEEVIQDNLANPQFTVDNLAKIMGLSRRQFYRKIKKITKQTPNDLIQEIRLKTAKVLLADNAFPSIEAIAEAVGYKNVNHFSKLYEAHFGERPKRIT